MAKRKNSAGKYERALKLAQAKSLPSKTVYDLLVAADKEGDVRATYALATWYIFGSPFTKIDHRNANKMLRKASDGGVADAAYDLAVSYEKGIGIRKSEARAFELYVRAALLGDAQSHHEVGRMYYWGIGVARNRWLADSGLDKAAKLGVED